MAKKIVVSFQLPPEVVAMYSVYAQVYGVPKQVAVERLIVEGFKSHEKNKEK